MEQHEADRRIDAALAVLLGREPLGTGVRENDGGGGDDRRLPTKKWLTYDEAAEYTGLSVRYLRNLVSAGLIPVYGLARSRRFRVDMLDLWLRDRDAAMRKFLAERQAPHAD